MQQAEAHHPLSLGPQFSGEHLAQQPQLSRPLTKEALRQLTVLAYWEPFHILLPSLLLCSPWSLAPLSLGPLA